MEDLNHQSIKWNGSELNHEVFWNVSRSKKEVCYSFCIEQKGCWTQDLLTVLQIPTAKLRIPDTGRVATAVDMFLSDPWVSAVISTQLYTKGFPKVTSSLQKAVSVSHTVKIVVLGMRCWSKKIFCLTLHFFETPGAYFSCSLTFKRNSHIWPPETHIINL